MANWKQIVDVLKREVIKLSRNTRDYPELKPHWKEVLNGLKELESSIQQKWYQADPKEILMDLSDDMIEIEDIFADNNDKDNRRRAQGIVKAMVFYAKG